MDVRQLTLPIAQPDNREPRSSISTGADVGRGEPPAGSTVRPTWSPEASPDTTIGPTGPGRDPGIIPAPYSARYYWIALETEDAVTVPELKRLLRRSYDLVVEKLPKKARSALG